MSDLLERALFIADGGHNSVNVAAVAERSHGLLAFGTSIGTIEFFDPRELSSPRGPGHVLTIIRHEDPSCNIRESRGRDHGT